MPKDEYPKTRIVGICFGLQVIARAFGPSTIKENPKGWYASHPLKYGSSRRSRLMIETFSSVAGRSEVLE
jgi:GMP synthase-like glutamine amidotransferase